MPENYKGYADPSLVISVDETSKLLKNKDTIFVDTRNYWKYVKGHIPGAANLELYAFHWVDTSKGAIEGFVEQMEMLIRSLGISSETDVVFYQNNSGYDAARGVWLLNFLGHKSVRLLDGGLNLWKRKGLPVSTKDPAPRPTGNFTAKIDKSTFATLDSLRDSLKTSQVLDARSPGEYNGTYRRALKSGHVSGASNVEWKLALRRDGTLKGSKQLSELYSRLSPRKDVVTYCQSGYRAAHSWLVLRLLGFADVKNYLGSWYEWGNNPKTPVES